MEQLKDTVFIRARIHRHTVQTYEALIHSFIHVGIHNDNLLLLKKEHSQQHE